MPLNNTTTFSYPNASNFTGSLPSYMPRGNADLIKNYVGKWYGNISKNLNLTTTDYSYIEFDVTYSGSAELAAITFSTPNNSPIAVGTDLNDLFVPFSDGKPISGYDIKLSNGVTKKIYVIVNGDQTKKTNLIQIHTSVGTSSSRASAAGSTITCDYTCGNPLYSYLTGVHTYSPYDAINSPKLTTYLYSVTPIGSWTTDTKVWADSSFGVPAFPYYYGYGSYVYKIGGELNREYGIKKTVTVKQTLWNSIRGKKPEIKETVLGPQKWSNSGTDSTDACVNVLMTDIGKVKETITAASLVQPLKYKYYMGYNASSANSANNNYFKKYVIPQQAFYPITGETHATVKLAQGFIDGFDTDTNLGAQSALALASGVPIIAGAFAGAILKTFFVACVVCPGGFNAAAASALGAILGPIFIVLGALALIAALFVWNSSTTYSESGCASFLHHYTTTPYIELSSALSRTSDLTTNNNGYYSDGVYHYQQSGGLISSKNLSSITGGLVKEDPLQLGSQISLQADSPTLVQATNKLLLLPYTSGKPIPYCGEGNPIYYSEEKNETLTLTECAELVINPGTINITLDASSSFSCISLSDANNKALPHWNKIKSLVTGSKYNYSTVLTGSGLGVLESQFTHELKIEDTPNNVSLYFNNTASNGLVIGKKVFFDIEGRYEALDGYYSTSSISPYKTFYQTSNGAVVDIYTISTSGSNTAINSSSSSFNLVTSSLNHTSDWYFYSLDENNITNYVLEVSKPRCYDPNTLISDSRVRKGYVTPNSSSFFLYSPNTTTGSIVSASTGWYNSLINWKEINPFYYNGPQTITINTEEICYTSLPLNGQLYGFYIVGSTGSINSPLYNEVKLTTQVYSASVLLATYGVTSSADQDKTYIPYGNEITTSTVVDSIIISSIDSTNPIDKILYVTGSFINCVNTTPTPTPTSSPTPLPATATPTPTPTSTATPTPEPATATPTPTPTPTFTSTPTFEPATATPTPTPTSTATPTPTPTPTCVSVVNGDWTFTGPSSVAPSSTNTYTVNVSAPSSTSYPIIVAFTRFGGASHTPSSLTFNSAGSQTMTVTTDSSPTNDYIEAYIASSDCGNTSDPIRITFTQAATATPTPTPSPTPSATPTATPTDLPATSTPTPTSPPTATPTPTPVPTPTLSVDSTGCTGYEGTGYINLSASGGSGNYTFHISQTPPPSYNGVQNASNLSNGTYYVGVYDNTYGTSDVTTRNISCAAAPTPTPTTPPTPTPTTPPTSTPTPTPTPSLNPFYISTSQTVENVCTAAVDQLAYSDGATNPPVFGDTIYSDSAGTSPYGAGYYNTDNGYIRLDGSGTVIDSGIC